MPKTSRIELHTLTMFSRPSSIDSHLAGSTLNFDPSTRATSNRISQVIDPDGPSRRYSTFDPRYSTFDPRYSNAGDPKSTNDSRAFDRYSTFDRFSTFDRYSPLGPNEAVVPQIISELAFLSGKPVGDIFEDPEFSDNTPSCFLPRTELPETEWEKLYKKVESNCIRLGVFHGLLQGLQEKLYKYEEELFDFEHNLKHHEKLLFDKEAIVNEFWQSMRDKDVKLNDLIERGKELSILINTKVASFNENITKVSRSFADCKKATSKNIPTSKVKFSKQFVKFARFVRKGDLEQQIVPFPGYPDVTATHDLAHSKFDELAVLVKKLEGIQKSLNVIV